MASNNSSCVNYFHRNELATIRLFCFHYAGGNATVFKTWHELLPKNLEIAVIQFPGRMNLSSIKPYTCMHPLVNCLYKELLPHLMDKPFVFFGHSLGALVGFELARFIQQHHGLLPEKLISAACQAPNKPRGQKKISTLPEKRIIKELIAYNHTPPELYQNAELMQIVLPIIRADFAVNETYQYIASKPLNCPITVYGGIDDLTVNHHDLNEWHIETNKTFKLHLFSGDHFFIFKHNSIFLHQLSFELEQF